MWCIEILHPKHRRAETKSPQITFELPSENLQIALSFRSLAIRLTFLSLPGLTFPFQLTTQLTTVRSLWMIGLLFSFCLLLPLLADRSFCDVSNFEILFLEQTRKKNCAFRRCPFLIVGESVFSNCVHSKSKKIYTYVI